MIKSVISNGETEIGAFRPMSSEKPVIGVIRGTKGVIYGHFIDDERAKEFMKELAKFIGIKEDER